MPLEGDQYIWPHSDDSRSEWALVGLAENTTTGEFLSQMCDILLMSKIVGGAPSILSAGWNVIG